MWLVGVEVVVDCKRKMSLEVSVVVNNVDIVIDFVFSKELDVVLIGLYCSIIFGYECYILREMLINWGVFRGKMVKSLRIMVYENI